MASQSAATLLLVHTEHWTLFRADQPEEPVAQISLLGDSAEEAAHRLKESLSQHKLTRIPMVVALESDLCLAAPFRATSLRQARSREALTYQLEEPLPIAAEEVTAAFVVDGVQVFGVCCPSDWLQELLEKLSEAGALVRSVSPLALLATSELALTRKLSSSPVQTVWIRPHQIEQVLLQNQHPTDWRSLPKDPAALQESITAEQLTSTHSVPRIILGNERAVELLAPGESDEVILTSEEACLAYAAKQAERIARGEDGFAVDLLRYATEKTSRFGNPLALEQLAWKCAALLLLTTAVLWQWSQGSQASKAVRQLEEKQTDLFRQTFPDKRVPQGVRSRLESELRRIAGTRADISETPEHTDAVLLLEQLLSELPKNLRYRLLELRIEGSRIYLVGEVRSHSDADKIAAALRRAGLTVSPPSTQQLAGKGVEFRLTATRASLAGEAAS